ncbi:MAG: kinase/pyrophosphorylase [Gammaproteobacteria bacterium]|nr:kinase/pyrophosphorylase [Gammaproteobacteria bacterium]MBU1776133.1 kinase/pyrophosphorylase [Gammaproteobacteria bacterium]MBU1968844.1 kinase/pyrophosphorylase [Gammaproteobacteria bacterium]
MTTQKRTVIYVSDGTGITSETLGHGLLAQFEGIEFRHLRFPFLDSADKVGDCVSRINEVGRSEGARPIVIMTLTNTEYSALLHKADALFIDLFDAFIVPLEQELGCRYSRAVGRSHSQANPEYNSRIAAVNFALAHDDGVSDNDLKNADIILVGVSRSGKTPTSLYLSLQFSLKAANYPLIPEDFERGCLPSKLLPFRDKLFGLTIAPEQLNLIRNERRANSKYASLENCRYEVGEAEKMMKREGIKWFDTTSKSIEELAVQLMQELNLER